MDLHYERLDDGEVLCGAVLGDEPDATLDVTTMRMDVSCPNCVTLLREQAASAADAALIAAAPDLLRAARGVVDIVRAAGYTNWAGDLEDAIARATDAAVSA